MCYKVIFGETRNRKRDRKIETSYDNGKDKKNNALQDLEEWNENMKVKMRRKRKNE